MHTCTLGLPNDRRKNAFLLNGWLVAGTRAVETTMNFSQFDLDPQILKAIADCGYDVPTPIQIQAVPEALAGRDLLASAGTGTGKTAAFMLPALHRLATKGSGRKGAPRVLVLAPTRELAGQVMDAARTYGKYLPLKTAVLLGGVPYREQFRALAKPLDLVVATPGRLLDHLDRRSIDLSCLELLILDEGRPHAGYGIQRGCRQGLLYGSASTPDHDVYGNSGRRYAEAFSAAT